MVVIAIIIRLRECFPRFKPCCFFRLPINSTLDNGIVFMCPRVMQDYNRLVSTSFSLFSYEVTALSSTLSHPICPPEISFDSLHFPIMKTNFFDYFTQSCLNTTESYVFFQFQQYFLKSQYVIKESNTVRLRTH